MPSRSRGVISQLVRGISTMRPTVLFFLLARRDGPVVRPGIDQGRDPQASPAGLARSRGARGLEWSELANSGRSRVKNSREIWLRKATPTSEKPSGPKGAIQFPFLADGELLGILEFAEEGHDYRDQSIAKGVYTMRYGLQPVNGDHLGVSTYRDYVLLLPASKDKALSPPTRKQLEERSAESAGTSHPAVVPAPHGAQRRQAGPRLSIMTPRRTPGAWSCRCASRSRARASRSSIRFNSSWSGRLLPTGEPRMTDRDSRFISPATPVEEWPFAERFSGLNSIMMPVSLLIALILAFGFDPPRGRCARLRRDVPDPRDLRRDQPGGDPGVRPRFVGRLPRLTDRVGHVPAQAAICDRRRDC